MDAILILSCLGISASVFLAILFLTKSRFSSTIFLGIFFLLLGIKLGKLLVQEYAPIFVLNGYFNLVHAAFLGIGPVMWLYVRTYLYPSSIIKKVDLSHFIPSFLFLIGAFFMRQVSGEQIWLIIYYFSLAHPLVYVTLSLHLLFKNDDYKILIRLQRIWLYSLLGVVVFIVSINMLYFWVDFPFYLVTAFLLLLTVYLIAFLGFNNMLPNLLGKKDQKYRNLNWTPTKIDAFKNKIESLLIKKELYLNDQLKLSDISDQLNTLPHIVSMVINETSGKNFSQYINYFRVKKAQDQLRKEKDKKIIAIAFESGFSSLSTFNRVFKEYTDLSPKAYRAKYSDK